jgi:hypothetical protein
MRLLREKSKLIGDFSKQQKTLYIGLVESNRFAVPPCKIRRSNEGEV